MSKIENKRELITSLAEDAAIELLKTLKREVKRNKYDITLDNEAAIKNIRVMVQAISVLSNKPLQLYTVRNDNDSADEYSAEVNDVFKTIIASVQPG